MKIILIIFLSLFSCHAMAQHADLTILEAINPRDPNSGYWIQTSASAYWLPAAFVVGTLGWGFVHHNRKVKTRGYEAVISIGGATLLSEVMKRIVDRTRPADRYPMEVFAYSSEHGRSFPSGHTTAAFSTATTISLEYRRWYFVVPAYLWAASVGYSRLYLGEHYPSDVLAGAAIGIATGYLSHWLTKKVFMH